VQEEEEEEETSLVSIWQASEHYTHAYASIQLYWVFLLTGPVDWSELTGLDWNGLD